MSEQTQNNIFMEWDQSLNKNPVDLINVIRTYIRSKLPDQDVKLQIQVYLYHCKLLLFHVSDENYPPFNIPLSGSIFIPQTRHEEVLLSLNVAETLSKKACEFSMHQHLFFVYSVLTLMYCNMNTQLIRLFERMVGEITLPYDRWLSYAYLMINSKYIQQSLPIISQITTRPNPPSIAKTLHYHAILLAEDPYKLLNETTPTLYKGIAYSQLSLYESTQTNQQHSLSLLMPLVNNSSLARFHASLLLADIRNPIQALSILAPLIQTPTPHLYPLRLAILLLTSLDKKQEALQMVTKALIHYPKDIFLLVCKLRLLPEVTTLQTLFKSIETLQVLATTPSNFLTSVGSSVSSTSRSLASGLSSRAIAETKLMFVEKETIYGAISKSAPASLWKEASLLFNKLGLNDDVVKCLNEGIEMSSLIDSDALDKQIGLLPVNEDDFTVLKTQLVKMENEEKMLLLLKAEEHGCVQATIERIKILMDNNLAMTDLLLLKTKLQDCLKVLPLSTTGWELLGDIFQKLENDERACECFETAIKLNNTQPIIPFSCIPRNAALD
ncbi:Tetratricopeptide repeat-containing protein [Entamoeba marina]